MKLAKTVRALQAHFGPIGTAGFPKNAQLMESLRQNASLTDAMAALQLSCRLEAVEKTLGRMTQLLSTVIGITPGIAVDVSKTVFFNTNHMDYHRTLVIFVWKVKVWSNFKMFGISLIILFFLKELQIVFYQYKKYLILYTY